MPLVVVSRKKPREVKFVAPSSTGPTVLEARYHTIIKPCSDGLVLQLTPEARDDALRTVGAELHVRALRSPTPLN